MLFFDNRIIIPLSLDLLLDNIPYITLTDVYCFSLEGFVFMTAKKCVGKRVEVANVMN